MENQAAQRPRKNKKTGSQPRAFNTENYVTQRPPKKRKRGGIGPIRFRGKTVPHFFQGDERWGGSLLNHDDSISTAGCAVSSVASVCEFFGRNVTPADVDRHLDRNNGYLAGSDGIANWDIALATGETPNLVIKLARSLRTYQGDSEEEIYELVDESLSQGIPVIGRIKYGNSSADYNHFLVLAGKSRKGKNLLVDPGLRHGDGPANPKQADVVLEKATRNGGLQLVGIQVLSVSTS